jgi:hypothetical protein
MGKINLVIEKLEQGLRLQSDFDITYDEWCKIFKSEMYKKLNYKTIYPNDTIKLSSRKRKPWWNQELTDILKSLHAAEHRWLRCNDRAIQSTPKQEYSVLRKTFDRKVDDSIIRELMLCL